MNKFDSNLARVLTAAFILLTSSFLSATSIQKFTFEEMVELSALIVEAEVIEVTTFTEKTLVHTSVLMAVHDVLKGDDPGDYLELDFLGGETADLAVRVSGQDIPLAGEKGFYFIEDLSGNSVNPLIGWSQGHFRIITDAKGTQSLLTDIQQEVMEITGNKNAILASKLKNMKFSSNLVREADFAPVTPDELRDAVNAILVTE